VANDAFIRAVVRSGLALGNYPVNFVHVVWVIPDRLEVYFKLIEKGLVFWRLTLYLVYSIPDYFPYLREVLLDILKLQYANTLLGFPYNDLCELPEEVKKEEWGSDSNNTFNEGVKASDFSQRIK